MDIYHSLDEIRGLAPGSFVTIGNFDGLHLGHQALLHTLAKRLESVADEHMRRVVVTFDPHPMVYFRGLQPESFHLGSAAQKARALAAADVDAMLILPFSRELAAMSADDFVRAVLVEALAAREVWVGHDFRFGKGRRGTIEDLQWLGMLYGFRAHALPAVLDVQGQVISSSRVRAMLSQGQVEQASALLGRPYALEGVVTKGDGRGKGLGIPTANLTNLPQLLPALGVYVTTLQLLNPIPNLPQTLSAITNIGRRPTFHGQDAPVVVETFLLSPGLSPDLDLYDQPVSLSLHKFLRPEQRFDSPASLVAQIQRDIQDARAFHGLP